MEPEPIIAVPRVPLQRVILTGFMGSGKTSVGRCLAARLGWNFTDLDDEITRRCGLAVPEIFASLGEAHFRRQESLALAECLTRAGLVLALGGGAPEAEANRALLRGSEGTAVIHLSGRFETLHARCVAQSTQPGAVGRPVLADFDLARERFTKRAPFYSEIATITLDSEAHSPEDLAAQVAEALQATFALSGAERETP